MVRLIFDCQCGSCDGGTPAGKDEHGNQRYGGSHCVCQCHKKDVPVADPIDEKRLEEYCRDSSGNIVKGMIHCMDYTELYDSIVAMLKVVRAAQSLEITTNMYEWSRKLKEALAPFSQGEKESNE
jgi:hypothetical protein